MKNFTEEMEHLEMLLDLDLDQNLTLVAFINAFQKSKEFNKQCRPFDDFILRKHFIQMAAQTNKGKPVELSKIEFFKADKYQFIYGSGQSEDLKIVAMFFLFEKTGKGLMNCLNHNTGNGILGPFTLTRTAGGAANFGEISLN